MASSAQPPDVALRFGSLVAVFAGDGALTLEGQGWPKLTGSWRAEGETLILKTTGGPAGCDAEARYTFRREGTHLRLELLQDECGVRRIMLDRSNWAPITPATRPAGSASTTRITRRATSWYVIETPLASSCCSGEIMLELC